MKKIEELPKEIKMIYDFCSQKQYIADKYLENARDNMILNTQFVAEGTAYWAVKSFIEVNFLEV